MAKAIGLIALSLSLEAAFLFQISVIARPEPRAAAPAAQIAAEPHTSSPAASVASAAGRSSTVAQSSAPALPRS